MTLAVALVNLVLGAVYTSYGFMTLVDMKREWRTSGFSHFGAAWVAMAFTCGPHHLDHGLHGLIGRQGGPLDLTAVLVGFPAGVIWFLLRVEAFTGGKGDRFIPGTPGWLAATPTVSAVYVTALGAALIPVLTRGGSLTSQLAPNVMLFWLYMTIGYFLLRTQFRNRRGEGGWSLSGVTLGIVFPTCALMHAMHVAYWTVGRYDIDWHGLTIDWIGVPAAAYFLWVVHGLYRGAIRDWSLEPERVPVLAG